MEKDHAEQMKQLQEDFFKQIQAKEDEISKLQASLEFKAELKEDTPGQKASAPDSSQQVLDQAVYQEEEQFAKRRKDAGIKYQKTSAKLQSLLEVVMTDQGLLAKRVEGVRLLGEMSEIISAQIQDNKGQQLERIKQASKTKSLGDNITFLEQRLSDMMTEKEEQAIKLKSEIIVHK